MKNGDILRRLRYSFDFDDVKIIDLFNKGGYETTRAEISDWLKKEEDENHKPINDRLFAIFLNGLIINYRGTGGEIKEPEKKLTNNIILRKLKIALEFKEDDMLAVFGSMDVELSKHELSAFFRRPEQSQYRECKDQYLRAFLDGIQRKYRD